MLKQRPLTQPEAVARTQAIAVDSYDIRLDLSGCENGAETFGSQTIIRFSCLQPGASTFAEFRGPGAATAALNGVTVPVADGRIELDQLAASNELVVQGRGEYSTSGEGLHRAVDPADEATYIYSNCFLHDASRVFACFDQPDLKAVMRLHVTAPAGWTVVSNAPAKLGERGSFEPTPRLPPYLVALAAGPYVGAHSSWQPAGDLPAVPLALYCRRSLVEVLDAEELFDITRAGLSFYADTFGVSFPFAKFDQLFAPEFNGGAMENAGLVIHMDELLFPSAVTDADRGQRAMIVLHELAHMWFGDLVTMRWWDDLWLNEAFATYCAYLATAEVTGHDGAWATFCISEKMRARFADERPSRHPVSSTVSDTDAALLNFDAISYNKGASLLRQLSAYVGRDHFFDGVHAYFEQHAWQNSELVDLLHALESASGLQLAEWSNNHLKTVGLPRCQVDTEVDPQVRTLLTAHVVQLGEPTQQRMGIGAYARDGNRFERIRYVEVDLRAETTPLPSFEALPVSAVILPNDGDLGYTSIRLDPRSMAAVFKWGVSSFDDPIPRALIWGSIWDRVMDGELAPATFVAQVARSVADESKPDLLRQLFSWAEIATERLVPHDEMLRLRASVCDAAALAVSAVASKDLQLELIRAHARFACTKQQLSVVASRLDGEAQQGDIAVDADLRWHLLYRLAAAGLRSENDVVEEFVRDNTAFGRYWADRAMAALPQADAKKRAWLRATAAVDGTNRQVGQACAGFWQGNQRELTRPYIDRYFAELERVWLECDTEIAHLVTLQLFPRHFVEAHVFASVDDYLKRRDLPAGLRRILTDERYDLDRCLRIRETHQPPTHVGINA